VDKQWESRCSKKQAVLSIKQIVASATLMVWMSVSSCSDDRYLPTPPLSVPMRLDQAGAVTEFEFVIREHAGYYMGIEIDFPADDHLARNRLRRLVGDNAENKYGERVNPGIPTPVTLTIHKIDNSTEIMAYKRSVFPLLTSADSNTFEKRIGRCDFLPGRYRAKIETLNSVPQFTEFQVNFAIFFASNFKNRFNPKFAKKENACPHLRKSL
jgi:hypothetical protein